MVCTICDGKTFVREMGPSGTVINEMCPLCALERRIPSNLPDEQHARLLIMILEHRAEAELEQEIVADDSSPGMCYLCDGASVVYASVDPREEIEESSCPLCVLSGRVQGAGLPRVEYARFLLHLLNSGRRIKGRKEVTTSTLESFLKET